MSPDLRREMYGRDITYGTASEFGFDYLRDNGMATRKEDQVQRDHWFCIVRRNRLHSCRRSPHTADHFRPGAHRARTTVYPAQAADRPSRQRPDPPLQPFRLGCDGALSKSPPSAEDRDTAARKMLQVKMGNPNNKQLLRLLETPEWRKLLDKVETDLNSDLNKDELYRLKEDLLYVVDERQHQADLTEIGRQATPSRQRRCVRVARSRDRVLRHREGRRRLRPSNARPRSSLRRITTPKSPRRFTRSPSFSAPDSLYERDVEYVVQEGKVMIVDENTGRVMPGRRWSDGLHQAVEAKENVMIERETRTYATITIQNYFRMYEKLAGMTGTAETEATEFQDIYRLAVQVIPTNKALHPDRQERLHFQNPPRQVQCGRQRNRDRQQARAARARRHGERRVLGSAFTHVETRRRHPRRAQRQIPPARSRDRLPAQASAAP